MINLDFMPSRSLAAVPAKTGSSVTAPMHRFRFWTSSAGLTMAILTGGSSPVLAERA